MGARAGLTRALPRAEQVNIPVRAVTEDEALRVHSPQYLTHLRHVLRTGWGHIDADTYFCPDTEEAAWLAAGGAVELCRALLHGPLHRGIALLRPPGHHARASQAMGFCFLNNVAIAAADALAQGAKRVAIVDWDVHHGNGIQEAFYEDKRVLYLSLHQAAHYPGTGTPEEVGGAGAEGYNVNIPMPPQAGSGAYGEAFRTIVLPILDAFEADIVLVSAGLDGHVSDPLADLELDADCFGAMTTALVRHVDGLGHGRLALFLEGGYGLEAIGASVAAMVKALRGEESELSVGPLRAVERRALLRTMRAVEDCWPR